MILCNNKEDYMLRIQKKYIYIITIFLCFTVIKVGKRPLYMLIWGKPSSQKLSHTYEQFADIVPPQQWQETTISGYKIKYQLRKKYKVCGRVVWVDWNDGLINTWYHSAQRPSTKLYNAVAAVDVSIIHGATSADNNWNKIKFDHEERGLRYTYLYADNPIVNTDEINNNHVIPASSAIRRALAIIKKGEFVEMEGYLMDWKGTGKFANFNIKTATAAGDIHTEKLYGGRYGAGLCRQFYVTKVTINGYTFE